jgi:hypothetical protein
LVSSAEEVACTLAAAFEVVGCMVTVAESASGFTLITPESVFSPQLVKKQPSHEVAAK